MPTGKFRVDGMTGRACEQKVQQEVRALPGVFGAVASHTDHCLEVDFEDDEVGFREIIAAVDRAGYSARLVG